jgi:hypothetical protein
MASVDIRERQRVFELFEKLKVKFISDLEGSEQRSECDCQEMLSNEPADLGINTLVGRHGNFSSSSLRSIVDEAAQLSIKMCIADAIHDNTIIENVQDLQSRSLQLLNILAGQLRNIQDRASLKSCQDTCKEVIQEVEKEVLAVETEMVCKADFTTKSTVISSWP